MPNNTQLYANQAAMLTSLPMIKVWSTAAASVSSLMQCPCNYYTITAIIDACMFCVEIMQSYSVLAYPET